MILVLLLFILFIIWTCLMKLDVLKNVDDFVYKRITFSDFKTLFYKIITSLACTPFLIVSCSLMVLFMDDKRKALIVSVLMLIDAFIVFVFKHIIKRERPNIKRLVKEKGYSFPSGHTFSATCFYGFLLFLLLNNASLNLKIVLITFYLLFVFLIAKSRIYLGVHYFSDVIAGFILALSYLFLYVYFVYDFLNLL